MRTVIPEPLWLKKRCRIDAARVCTGITYAWPQTAPLIRDMARKQMNDCCSYAKGESQCISPVGSNTPILTK